MGFMLNILYLVILLNILIDILSNSIMLIICQICILILYICLLIICDMCLYLKPIRMATKHPSRIALYVTSSLWKIKRIEYLTKKRSLDFMKWFKGKIRALEIAKVHLPIVHYELMHLKLQNFKSVSEYSTLDAP
jgi:predicted Kef-type K+ transport protein